MISEVSYFAALGLLLVSIGLISYVLLSILKRRSSKLQGVLAVVAIVLQIAAMISVFALHNSQIADVNDFMMQYNTTNSDFTEETMNVDATEVQ